MTNITVIGSGTMGNGIAHTFALCGYKVNLVDVNENALQKAIATITKNLDRQVQKGGISEELKSATLKNISTHTDITKAAANAALGCKIINPGTGNVWVFDVKNIFVGFAQEFSI